MDLRTGEVTVVPMDSLALDTVKVIERRPRNRRVEEVDAGSLRVKSEKGTLHATQDNSLGVNGAPGAARRGATVPPGAPGTVTPRFAYSPPPSKPARRKGGGGRKRNGKSGEDTTSRGPTQISVEFGG